MLTKSKFSDWIHRDLDILILPIAFVAITVILGILNPDKFLTSNNISAMAFQVPELGLFTFAMMIAMITGGINLSIISTANLAGVIMAILMTRVLPAELSPVFMGIGLLGIVIIGLFIAAMLGSVNGLLIAFIGTSPVLTTIGTMILYEGLTLAITKGYVISGCPDMFIALGNNRLAGIPAPFYIFIAAAAVLWLILKKRPFGRYLFYIGSNARAVKYSGIDVNKVIVKAYILSGVYSGLAGVVMLSRLGSANARYGASYMLLSVLLSVLGGTDPDGGFGKVSGIIIGLFTLQSLTSGFNLMNVNSYVTVALWGVLLLLIIRYRRFAEERRNTWLIKKIGKQE